MQGSCRLNETDRMFDCERRAAFTRTAIGPCIESVFSVGAARLDSALTGRQHASAGRSGCRYSSGAAPVRRAFEGRRWNRPKR
jgi:hypothetical protein